MIKKTGFVFTAFLLGCFCLLSGCSYKFNETGGLDTQIKTVRVQYIDNRAPYVNTQLSPNLTERLKLKIGNQTKLTRTNNDNANLDISGVIRDYSVTTSGITSANGRSQTSINRLNVGVHIVVLNNITGETKEYDVSRQFDFGANQSLQTAESQLLDEMVRNLTDEIFNRIFSNW